MKRYKKQTADVESISKMLEEGLDRLFESEKYREFLEMMSQFPNYSYRNILLLLRQCPHASRTRMARGWIKEGRIVKAGERGLRIIAPITKEEENKWKTAARGRDKFRSIRVFDISQTQPLAGQNNAPQPARPVRAVPFPFYAEELQGRVKDFDLLMGVLRDISPYSIFLQTAGKKDLRKGYTDHNKRKIVVRNDMSQLHTIKTVVHEMAHALLHSTLSDVQRREMEAESIAFIVCRHLGLDTSEYSFQYIAAYSIKKEKKELKAFLDTIQKTACYLIDSIDGELEARRIGYDNQDLFVLVNSRTVMQLHNEGYPIYLVYPQQGEMFATKKEQLLDHDGPFAVEIEIWRDMGRGVA